jgi:hypothetical protein
MNRSCCSKNSDRGDDDSLAEKLEHSVVDAQRRIYYAMFE